MIVDVPSHYALHVCNDGVKDVAADATTNKVADHVTTDIATVLEEILHEDENKAMDSDIIIDMTEGVVYEALGQTMAEASTGMQQARKL